ncbi:hypothetical protein PPMP20_03965 [Paraburkholderia phymatum]|uniref:Uncharacterized protein n=1 Tax=Paraburkholderia phymatum (strain DSM 17167 / CIP 108236 / LMG 21445 / STM815) TaxID=391038 RepID=B2JSN9_PARP8|nr:hypothetical protein [Paraburkholderia phymatum]ACC75592.1 conserved hypothetical protein [Paraburkholderia phymatum STM815]
MKFEAFDSRLSQMLRAMPAATFAELTDGMIAWWNGSRIVYAWIGDEADHDCCDKPRAHELDLADDWGQFHDWLAAWIDEPRFSTRPEPAGDARDNARNVTDA